MAVSSPPNVRGWLRLRVTHLLILVPWVGLVVVAHRPLRDNSFLWHVRAGSLQLSQGEVIRHDPFSFTLGGAEWRTQSWLADLLYGQWEGWFGLEFVPVLILTTSALTLLFVGIACYRRVRDPLALAAGMFVAFWVGAGYFSPRPVLFSYLLLAVLLVLLERPNSRWALPFVIWLWASVHGSFVLGIGLILLEGVRSRDRHRLADGAASVVAASLTAHGLAIWGVLIDFFQNRGALALVTEWAPPDLLRPSLFPYLLVLAAFVIAASRGRLSPRDLWVPLPFLLIGLTSTRLLLPALIVALPWSLRAWPERTPRTHQVPSRRLAVLNGLIGASMLIMPFVFVSYPGLSSTRFPVAAAAHLGEGRTFHDDVTGGYLIWRGTPVYVDDRAELYGEDLLEEMISVRNARPGWEEVLDERGITQALVKTSDPLAGALMGAGWHETYRDEDFAVIART